MLCERTRGDAEKTWRSSHGKAGHRKAEAFRAPLKPMSGQAGAMRDPSVAAGAALSLVAATKGGEMNQVEKAARFAELHVKGAPLLLYNAWDAGTAKSILDAGAKAIATSSWAVAEAQGYRDGEAIPITLVEQIIARIVSTIDAPV